MPPQPPNPSHVPNPQWRPKRLRPPAYHNNNGGNFQHFQNNNYQNNDSHHNKRPRFQQQRIQPQLKSCSKCPKSLPFESFSKRQWSLADFKRMCKVCVDDVVKANEAAMKSAAKTVTPVAAAAAPAVVPGAAEKDPLGVRMPATTASAPGGNAMKACSACPKSFSKEAYSNRQWTLTGTVRKCKACVVLVVKENEANMARVSEKAKEDKRKTYGVKGSAPESQPADDKVATPSKEENEGGKASEKERPIGVAPQAAKKDGNFESKGQGITVPYNAKELQPGKPSQEIGESQLEHFATGALKTSGEKKAPLDKNVEGDELKHYVAEALKTSGEKEVSINKNVVGDELMDYVTEALKTAGEKKISIDKNVQGDELKHYVAETLKMPGEKEASIDKNAEGDEIKSADETDRNEDACENVNVNIMVSKEDGNIGDEDAGVKLECKPNDPIPVKEEPQQEQAVEVVREVKSGMGDCNANSAKPLKEESHSEQAVDDDTFESPKQAVAHDALASSEQAVADDSLKSSEQAVADDSLKSSEQGVADYALQSPTNEASVDENHSGPQDAYKKDESEPANQSHISPGADVTVTTGSQGSVDSKRGDSANNGTS